MYPNDSPLGEDLKAAHGEAWRRIGAPGAFWSGAERVDMVAEARAAHDCRCRRDRKQALSPHQIDGPHQAASALVPAVVDMIHRIATDPQRLTRACFDSVLRAGVSPGAYVEVVSVIASAVVIDTLHQALGMPLPALPEPVPGAPSGRTAPDAVDEGAWVPITAAEQELSDTGLPGTPNIYRAMGLVPDAVDLFFTTFRPHYALKDIRLSISQTQAEFVASRVSALNECFY